MIRADMQEWADSRRQLDHGRAFDGSELFLAASHYGGYSRSTDSFLPANG